MSRGRRRHGDEPSGILTPLMRKEKDSISSRLDTAWFLDRLSHSQDLHRLPFSFSLGVAFLSEPLVMAQLKYMSEFITALPARTRQIQSSLTFRYPSLREETFDHAENSLL